MAMLSFLCVCVCVCVCVCWWVGGQGPVLLLQVVMLNCYLGCCCVFLLMDCDFIIINFMFSFYMSLFFLFVVNKLHSLGLEFAVHQSLLMFMLN